MNPLAILTADNHLRDDTPECRRDSFFEAQSRKIGWLQDLQLKFQVPIFDAGDLFHKGKPSHYLLNWACINLPPLDWPLGIYTVPGNHDLPNHNMDLLDSSGLGVLQAAGCVDVLLEETILDDRIHVVPFPWGTPPCPNRNRQPDCFSIAIIHTMTWMGKEPWPGCTDLPADKLLDLMSGYDVVLTGHNHKTFVVEKNGRFLVNPGSITRQTADQADHRPCVFLWSATKDGDSRVDPIYYPIDVFEENPVSRDHIEKIEEREERISAFVERLSGEMEVGLSFEQNLEGFFASNRVRTKVQDIVWEAVKGEGK